LNKKVKDGGFRLPTEAEWEYACRAGTNGLYHGTLKSVAWYLDNSGGKTHAVGKMQANVWGLFDMHGNVWEWCQDWYGNYPTNSVSDFTGPRSGTARVNRGGSWRGHDSFCRSANRGWIDPEFRGDLLGLRLAKTHIEP
jgi:formylglycine-generating enzyme required for sulfatase activity